MKYQILLTKILIICLSIFSVQTLLSLSPVHTYSVLYPIFSKDKSQLIFINSSAYESEKTIVKMSTKNGSIVKSVPLKLGKQIAPFAATPDGFKFLATSPKGIAVIHNGTGKVLRTLPYPAKNRNFDPRQYQQSSDGVLLAIPAINPNSRKIHVVHTGSGKLQYTIDLLKGEKWTRYPTVRGIGFSPKRRFIAYVFQASRKSTLHVYDLYKRKETLRLKLSDTNLDQGKIQFSKNGSTLIFSSNRLKKVALINLKQQSIKMITTGYSDFTSFTSDDKSLLLIQPYKNRVLTINIKTGKTTINAVSFQSKEGYFDALNIVQSADRSLLAMPIRATDHKNINQALLINGRNGQVLRQLKAYK